MTRFLIACAMISTVLMPKAAAQVSQTASVSDGSGRGISGGTFSGITASGQPGDIAVASAGGMVNYAGFLNTFSLQPGRDTDQDGLGDELDADNDNDALSDLTEIAGTAFDPATTTGVNIADSDGDGEEDGEESIAGTDPTDPDANLRIDLVDVIGSWAHVSWRSRGGKTYHVHGQDEISHLPGFPVATNTTSGGTAPWYVTTNIYSEAVVPAISNRYYMIRAMP